LKEVVQFKYINLCGGGLGERCECSSAQVSSEVIANTTQILSKKLTSKDFRPKKFREIQVILSEDQLIWFYQTFLLKSRTQISPVVLTNHTNL
jgi:predicted kinase